MEEKTAAYDWPASSMVSGTQDDAGDILDPGGILNPGTTLDGSAV